MYGILKNEFIDDDNSGEDDSELVCLFAAPIAVNSNRITFSSDTLSLKRYTYVGPAQRWELEVAIAASNFGVPFFINNIVKDVDSTVYVRMPQPIQKYGQARGAKRGTAVDGTSVIATGVNDDTLGIIPGPDVDSILLADFGDSTEEYPTADPILSNNGDMAFGKGTAEAQNRAAGYSTIEMTLNEGSEAFEGTFIKFANHSKVYLIQSINAIYDNTLAITLYPSLRSNVSPGEKVYLGNKVTARMNYEIDSIVGMRYSDGTMSDPGTVRLVEHI